MYKLSVRSFIFLFFLASYIQETVSQLPKQLSTEAIQISNYLVTHSLKSFVSFREPQRLYRSTFKGWATALSSLRNPTMTQPHSKGEPRYPAEPKPAPFGRKSSKAVQLHSLPPTKVVQSAATARWLDEKPGQEYWNSVARMSISDKGNFEGVVGH